MRAAQLSKKAIRLLVGGVVLAVVVGVGAYYLFGGGNTRTVTARFDSAVGVYQGTPVKILGVDVGKVTQVKPMGGYVTVKMTYDSKYKLPSNAISVIVANSLVSDRFVQLAPAYSRGPTLADNATIPQSRTASPAELDDIYAALNKLSVSLGPSGANKNGSLNELVKIAAANLKGNGAALGQSISKLSQATTTLANGREDLFGTVKNLQVFTKALSDSDTQVRHFNTMLATVAGDLAGERTDLAAALKNLGIALNQVADFVKKNQSKLHTDISGLKNITQILIDQQSSLNETLSVAPVALSNVVHAYQPNLGVLATRSNLASLTSPAALCALLDPALIPGIDTKTIDSSPLGAITTATRNACKAVLAKYSLTDILKYLGIDPSGLDPAAATKQIDNVLGQLTGLGGIITGGS